ncbi:MAG: DUF899 domain-containing protein [Alphaproteobacteria bacterium]|nr:MAG: DUF899 domain-containing protein [Alphaproteobacteria bacterium]
MTDTTTPNVVTREKWLKARLELLEAEKAFTRERDALSARRRALPWVRVDTPYRFDTPEGPASLADLFDGRSQLIVSHFMYGPDWEEGCPSCSFWADGYDGLDIHLAHRDTAFVAVSRAPLEKLLAYRERMGWRFRWVSSLNTGFNRDFGVSFTPEEIAAGTAVYNYRPKGFPSTEAPGFSVFARRGTEVYHTYSTYARGLDMMNTAYHLLDLTPKGRDEDGLPWPMAWLRRHDRYED